MARISGLPEQPRPLWSTVLMILSAGGSTGQLWECQICPVDLAPHWHWTFLNYAYHLCSNLLKWLLWLHMAARKYMQQSVRLSRNKALKNCVANAINRWCTEMCAAEPKVARVKRIRYSQPAILSFFSQPEPTHVVIKGSKPHQPSLAYRR